MMGECDLWLEIGIAFELLLLLLLRLARVHVITNVLFQIVLGHESSFAVGEWTCEGRVHVRLFVLGKNRLLSKLLEAYFAAVWLETRMRSDMLVENGLLPEKPLTLLIWTLVRLGICVNSVVLEFVMILE
jgi:hypothetical protein